MLKRIIAGLALITACGGDAAAPGPQPPVGPHNIVAAASAGDIVLTWEDATDETGYRVEFRRAASSSWHLLSELTANATMARHVGVDRNIEFVYRIRACNEAGCSEWKEASAAWRPTGEPPALSSISVINVAGHEVTLLATARSGGAAVRFVFSVYRAGESAPFKTDTGYTIQPESSLGVDSTATGRLRVDGLEPSREYTFTVVAKNEFGVGEAVAARTFRTATVAQPILRNPRTSAAFWIDVTSNGLVTEFRFEMVKAGQSFDTPVATEHGFADPWWEGISVKARWMLGLAERGVVYNWRVIATNSAGTTVSPTMEYRP